MRMSRYVLIAFLNNDITAILKYIALGWTLKKKSYSIKGVMNNGRGILVAYTTIGYQFSIALFELICLKFCL